MSLSENNETQPELAEAIKRNLSRIIMLTTATTLVLTGLMAGVFFVLTKPHISSTNPFAVSKPSTDFPLYYPKTLPEGYVADRNSVTSPHDGVILFNLNRGKDQIVVTEQARTSKMVDFSTFFKQIKGLKQTVVSDGSIATGYFGDTKLASRIGNKTWIIATTTSEVSLDQLSAMLQSLTTAD
jgi:hypothetical protein